MLQGVWSIQSMEPNLYLTRSSLFFIAPCLVSYLTRDYHITFIYVLVTLVSSVYHATKHPRLLHLDVSTAHLAHLTTVMTILPGGSATMPYYFAWLSYACFIYYYGYKTQTMVFLPDLKAATPWHVSLHVSTSLMTCYTVYAAYLVRHALAQQD
jgi:hypothetical protein